MQADLRTEVAQEAARLICEQGMRDYAQAKTKALDSLAGGRGPVPTNQEIAVCVREYLNLFDHQAWRQRLRSLRETAASAMQLCRDFRPRLAGAAVDELATARSPVQLHLFCPFDEAVDLLLDEQRIPFDPIERRMRHPDGRELRVSGCAFMAGDVEVEMLCFGQDDLRWSPLSPVDGRPMPRWTKDELSQSLAACGDGIS